MFLLQPYLHVIADTDSDAVIKAGSNMLQQFYDYKNKDIDDVKIAEEEAEVRTENVLNLSLRIRQLNSLSRGSRYSLPVEFSRFATACLNSSKRNETKQKELFGQWYGKFNSLIELTKIHESKTSGKDVLDMFTQELETVKKQESTENVKKRKQPETTTKQEKKEKKTKKQKVVDDSKKEVEIIPDTKPIQMIRIRKLLSNMQKLEEYKQSGEYDEDDDSGIFDDDYDEAFDAVDDEEDFDIEEDDEDLNGSLESYDEEEEDVEDSDNEDDSYDILNKKKVSFSLKNNQTRMYHPAEKLIASREQTPKKVKKSKSI